MGFAIAMIGILIIMLASMVQKVDKSIDKTAGTLLKNTEAQWEDKYCDSELTRDINRYVDDWTNANKIDEEVNLALEQMGLRGYLNLGKSPSTAMYQNRGLIMQILHVNRGKLYPADGTTGYPAGLEKGHGTHNQRAANFAYAKWMQDTLRAQGVQVELRYLREPGNNLYKDDVYAWVGSRIYMDKKANWKWEEFLFTPALLQREKYDIGEPYYKKNNAGKLDQ